jgi:plasmid maintenance system killer protein
LLPSKSSFQSKLRFWVVRSAIGPMVPKVANGHDMNHLKIPKGRRAGQHGIRINDQWRICFLWREGFCDEVEIVDYH